MGLAHVYEMRDGNIKIKNQTSTESSPIIMA